jgi:hypothetical protein
MYKTINFISIALGLTVIGGIESVSAAIIGMPSLPTQLEKSQFGWFLSNSLVPVMIGNEFENSADSTLTNFEGSYSESGFTSLGTGTYLGKSVNSTFIGNFSDENNLLVNGIWSVNPESTVTIGITIGGDGEVNFTVGAGIENVDGDRSLSLGGTASYSSESNVWDFGGRGTYRPNGEKLEFTGRFFIDSNAEYKGDAIFNYKDDNLKLGMQLNFSPAGGAATSRAILTATSTATSIPEPFTIIGTLIGGTAAFRMRKKLKATVN